MIGVGTGKVEPNDRVVDLCCRMIACESLSGREQAMADLVEETMVRLGYDCVERDALGSVVGIRRARQRSAAAASPPSPRKQSTALVLTAQILRPSAPSSGSKGVLWVILLFSIWARPSGSKSLPSAMSGAESSVRFFGPVP